MVFFCCDFHLRIDVVNLRPHREGAMYYSKYKSRSFITFARSYSCSSVASLKFVSAWLQAVAGGGAVESALSVYLEYLATTLGSREQLAIAEFAESLLIIPKVLYVGIKVGENPKRPWNVFEEILLQILLDVDVGCPNLTTVYWGPLCCCFVCI
ncbi:hypothetical protein P8452_28761 [Trifolium repens]|nr:hypothetical protein P8452_28761 [Trifolium repens]